MIKVIIVHIRRLGFRDFHFHRWIVCWKTQDALRYISRANQTVWLTAFQDFPQSIIPDLPIYMVSGVPVNGIHLRKSRTGDASKRLEKHPFEVHSVILCNRLEPFLTIRDVPGTGVLGSPSPRWFRGLIELAGAHSFNKRSFQGKFHPSFAQHNALLPERGIGTKSQSSNSVAGNRSPSHTDYFG